jgi:preprotein translocase subunit YajC
MQDHQRIRELQNKIWLINKRIWTRFLFLIVLYFCLIYFLLSKAEALRLFFIDTFASTMLFFLIVFLVIPYFILWELATTNRERKTIKRYTKELLLLESKKRRYFNRYILLGRLVIWRLW